MASLQKNLEPIACGEHKHPRIQTGADFLVHAAGFEFHIGIDIHVPHRHIQQPVAVNQII
ncbi:hypothetical protein UUU_16220 [Klebsiella pneumoniae subsp. pneumoniae DSM 30104 = JCM 1662 = NBRC 14940]|nr:hypothetical protein UUU_16220 [Klebsiella pneumoniae subsp. pneumoniae DSM 30104 = JCM 1662 = NBRC 14940]